ncbi:hypothetical protein GH714_008748 [Hevea brasiliensis]|uniref:Uncharacterized protein n=1 Tax=Hevea brasiliensis TaxID=3981 RepID=A0A6A6MH26_HEVBR|nr:hypothetical protein GH714_008748 [Hevea brasiliensis]
MNQFCCQKGIGSLYTILVGVTLGGEEDCDEEEGFLREGACVAEGATRQRRRSELKGKEMNSLEGFRLDLEPRTRSVTSFWPIEGLQLGFG